jgi:hypothetical protein
MAEEEYTKIITNVVPELTEVRFYGETVAHIKDEHPEVPIELPCVKEAVTRAVSDPAHVETSHSNSLVFVDGNSTNRSGDPLRVPVKIVGGTSGRIKTAFFASSNTDDRIIWSKKL